MADTNFDFDELDKAVNELMTGVDTSQRNTNLDDPEDKVVSLNDAAVAQPNLQPTPDQPIVAPVASAPVAPVVASPDPQTTTPSLAVKRRGQFMDMVHPSSDMSAAKPPVRRQGVSVEPRANAAASIEQAQTTEAENNVTVAPNNAAAPSQPMVSFEVEPATVTGVSETPAPATPEPIPASEPVVNVQPEVTMPQTPSVEENSPEQAPSEPQTPPAAVPTESATPMNSPFLPDAVVEKRPLGAHADAPADDGSSSIPEVTSEQNVEASETPAPAPEPLPAELNSDLVSIESGAAMSNSATTTPETEKSSDAEQVSMPSGPASIPQQYTEQPSSGDQTNAPIYDTAHFPEVAPAAKPAKKSSPLKLILLLIVLALVGAGAGVAYYFLNH